MESHPIANIFPMMSNEALIELSKDITSNGLGIPILLYEGKILDGRNRYQACDLAGIEPEYTEYEGDDPLGYVLSLNLHRRHLTASQRAALAVEVANMAQGGDRKSNQTAKLQSDISRSEAAEKLDVSERYVNEAKKIQRESPEHFDKVKSGELSLQQAKRKMEKEKLENLQSDIDPFVLGSRKKFKSVINHILEAKLESDGWQHTNDSVHLQALLEELSAIEQAHENTIRIQGNLESLRNDLQVEMRRQCGEGADLGTDGSRHITQLDDINLEDDEKILEAQIMELTEDDGEGQLTVAGLLKSEGLESEPTEADQKGQELPFSTDESGQIMIDM